jgi:choline dehydrogenase-like flavoprotein
VEYDDIVVGAGSSGATLAARLSEDPLRSVLLLEAGPDYRTIKETPHDLLRTMVSLVDHDWGWTAQATPQHEIAFPRGKVTGGCSAVNVSIAIRGVPADFDEWVALGNEEWSFAKVLPFYRKLEHDADFGGDMHGKGGPIWVERSKRSHWHPTVTAFHASCRAMGFADAEDFNEPASTGVGPVARNVRDGTRVSSAIGYLGAARNRLNLTIRGGCLVKRVVLENGRAIGVEVEVGGEAQQVYGKRITLSAGAIASPAILMRSGIGPRAELERHQIRTVVDAPGVGANLIDHPRVPTMVNLSSEAIERSANTHHSYPSVLLRYTASGSEEFNDMQLWLQPLVDWAMTGLPVDPSTHPKLLLFPSLQRPHSRGRITLRSASPNDQPNIELNYFTDPEDMRRMVDGMRLAWRLLHHPALATGWEGRVVGDGRQFLDQTTMDSDSALQDFIRNNCGTLFHPVGTARMGASNDKLAVVDEYCRVRGLEGLRVVDASVMPNIVRANTNLTCIMLGERAADWMRA